MTIQTLPFGLMTCQDVRCLFWQKRTVLQIGVR